MNRAQSGERDAPRWKTPVKITLMTFTATVSGSETWAWQRRIIPPCPSPSSAKPQPRGVCTLSALATQPEGGDWHVRWRVRRMGDEFTGTVLRHVVVVKRAVMMKKILKLLTFKWLWDRYKQRR